MVETVRSGGGKMGQKTVSETRRAWYNSRDIEPQSGFMSVSRQTVIPYGGTAI